MGPLSGLHEISSGCCAIWPGTAAVYDLLLLFLRHQGNAEQLRVTTKAHATTSTEPEYWLILNLKERQHMIAHRQQIWDENSHTGRKRSWKSAGCSCLDANKDVCCSHLSACHFYFHPSALFPGKKQSIANLTNPNICVALMTYFRVSRLLRSHLHPFFTPVTFSFFCGFCYFPFFCSLKWVWYISSRFLCSAAGFGWGHRSLLRAFPLKRRDFVHISQH